MTAPFRCLAIEAASPQLSVAACRNSDRAIRTDITPKGQARSVYGLIHEVLDELALRPGDLDCLAFGCGPGSFTGLRIAAAVAQSLAYGLRLPVCRVSSLAVLAARAARQYSAERVAASLDARMGELYLGIYRIGAGAVPVPEVAESVVAPADVRLPAQGHWFAAGPGWAAYPELAERHADAISGTDAAVLPDAAELLGLAAWQFEAGLTVAAREALPNYLREKVADEP